MRSRTVGAALALAVTGLVGLQAGAAPPAQAAAGGRHAPITVGVICSCTGGLASSNAGGPPVYQAWAREVNSHGGINGHKVDVIVKDDALNVGTALSEATSLIKQDHVVALVDASAVDEAFATYAQQQHVPIVGGDAASIEFFTNPDFFPAGETEDGFLVTYAYAAKKVGAKDIGNFYCAESASCQAAIPILKQAAASLGLRVGYVAEISASSPNYTAQCLAAKDAGISGLLIGEGVSTDLVVASDCSQQGYYPYYLEGDGAVAKSFTTAPGFDRHFIGFEQDIPFFTHANRGIDAMDKTLARYAGSVLRSPNYGEQEVEMWVSGLLLEAAVKAGKAGEHGPVTTAQLYKGLYALHGTTLGGMAPPLSYKAGHTHGIECWFWIGIKNHKFVTPYSTSPVCPSSS
ncbi:MAG: ABC transporter substrate-binding protein [Acidimicrobiales bacterium]